MKVQIVTLFDKASDERLLEECRRWKRELTLDGCEVLCREFSYRNTDEMNELLPLRKKLDLIVVLGAMPVFVPFSELLCKTYGLEKQYCDEYLMQFVKFMGKDKASLLKEFPGYFDLPVGGRTIAEEGKLPSVCVKTDFCDFLIMQEGADPAACLSSFAPKLFDSSKRSVFKIFGLTREQFLERSEFLKEFSKIVDWVLLEDGLDLTLSIRERTHRKSNKLVGILLENLIATIHQNLQKNLYAEEDISLEEQLYRLLMLNHKTVATAESLTGGLLAAKIVNIPGSSQVFHEGFVAYADEAKRSLLGVRERTLSESGAVSVECAYEMAAGLLNLGADLAVATTGIAGPTGASKEKPLGLTFIAVGTASGIHVYRHVFEGGRSRVREDAAQTALFHAVRTLRDSQVQYSGITIK